MDVKAVAIGTGEGVNGVGVAGEVEATVVSRVGH